MSLFTKQQYQIARIIYEDDKREGFKILKKDWDDLKFDVQLPYLCKAKAFIRVAKNLIKEIKQ